MYTKTRIICQRSNQSQHLSAIYGEKNPGCHSHHLASFRQSSEKQWNDKLIKVLNSAKKV
jgi:hypothetical protein